MHKLATAFAALAFALAAPESFALNTQTYTGSFGAFQNTGNISVGVLNEVIALPLFGKVVSDEHIVAPQGQQIQLQSVHLTLDASLSSAGTLTNNAVVNARGVLSVTLDGQNWQAVAGGPINQTFTFGLDTDVVLRTTSSAAGVYTIPANGGIWTAPQQNSNKPQQTYNSTGLTLLSGDWFVNGTFGIAYSLAALTNMSGQVPSGTGNFGTDFATGSWGQATIFYDYGFISAPVPATLPLIAFGLAALGLRRRFAQVG